MKLALYFFRLEESSGGAERMLFTLARELATRGHHVHVISWDRPGSTAFFPVPDGVVWHQLGFAPGLLDKLRRALALARLLRQIDCEVFVGFVMSTDKTVYAGCAIAGVPVVVAERNSPEMYGLKYAALTAAFYMALLHTARRIVVQLESYRRGYPSRLRRRIAVIPNPVRGAACSAQPDVSVDGRWVLLCAARLEPQKNPQVLLRAFARLADAFPDWRLRLAGEGSLRADLLALIDELGLAGRVEIAGAVRDVDAEYAAAHLFCLASRWEGFPNALAEAMAHALPVVGFEGCPGVRDLVAHGVDGLLATGNDDETALAETLGRFMSDPKMRRDFGLQAARIAKCFEAAPIVAQWERVLREAAGSPAGA